MDEPTTRLMVRGIGVDVALVVTGKKLVRAVEDAWRDALSSSDAPATPSLTVAVGPSGAADVAGATIHEVLHYLSPAVTTRMIEQRAGELVMLHAAALANPATGASAVLVAPSGTGKTTAASTLGRSLAYVTDETAAITPSGVVLPYRKPLSVIETGSLKAQRAPSDLGMLTTDLECHLGAILLLDRQVDHVGSPHSTTLEMVDALAALTPENSYLARLDRPLHRLAELIQIAGGVHRVTYRESADLAPLVADLLGASR